MRSPTDPPHRDRPGKTTPAQAREDRLKAALKANMARRKAQAKARGAGETPAGDAAPGETDNDGQV